MLEVVERASIGHGGDQRAELQGRHGNAFAERAHLAYAAELGGKLRGGEDAEVLAFNVVSGKLTEPELVGIIADLGKAKTATHGLKVSVVGVRERFRESHVRTAAEADGLFTGNDFFIQPGKSNSNLDGGAGLRAFTERELLVDHGQDASAGGIDGNDCAVHVAQGLNGSLAHDGIFTFNDVAICIVVTK